MTVWLTLKDAAKRVGKSERTIRNWIASGDLKAHLGRVREADLLECDKRMRERKRQGRPKGASTTLVVDEVADRQRTIESYLEVNFGTVLDEWQRGALAAGLALELAA